MRRAPSLSLALLLVACTPAPTPTAGDDCGRCHSSITAEHDHSLHAVAFTDQTFQASLALEAPEEHAFCTNCHAPTSQAKGVGCLACHTKPHEKRPAVACATCHEFTFDDRRAELVQETEREHQASGFASVPCPSCHMPKGDHRFVSGHDPSSLGRAVHVIATRAGAEAVRFEIRTDAGHAFPTGDMFRRARLEVFGDGEDGAIVADIQRTFGRTWSSVPNGRTQTTDTRIRGEWSETLALAPSAPIKRLRWQLIFERVLAVRGPHVQVASRDVIASGEL